MKLPILLIVVISIAWAKAAENVGRSARAPQGQSKYADSGTRINWEYLAPQSQLRSQRANAQRYQRAEGGSPHRLRQAQAPQHRTQPPQPQAQQAQQAPGPQYYSYKPYSAVPDHIRQLIDSVYQPQAPYVDPTSFIYGGNHFAAAPQQREQQPAPAASEVPRGAYLQPSARYQSIDPQHFQQAQPRYDYSERRVERQDRVAYKEDYEQQQQQQQQQQQEQQQVVFPYASLPESPLPVLYLDKNMPTEIKQLLKYQAQIPYDVTANRIQYNPKNIFIPKPLPDDVKGTYYYRSKVYYPNDESVDAEYPRDKPVDEEQRH
ncbi:PREDICTED: GATA zinc finger domain-containing protein 10-like [Vollenhovia emeryi]|uniref:GATA zinc finger domain-containing protein 10-like n=1 Tax=Vollenhovia emeryi TaxID=411798 RepID=UPI0005F4C503|nr:PREDICTED: GATA zinc finger domain-containing protein 10-like [Vollenhovia emeryi]